MVLLRIREENKQPNTECPPFRKEESKKEFPRISPIYRHRGTKLGNGESPGAVRFMLVFPPRIRVIVHYRTKAMVHTKN